MYWACGKFYVLASARRNNGRARVEMGGRRTCGSCVKANNEYERGHAQINWGHYWPLQPRI